MLRIVYTSKEIYQKYYTFLSSNLHRKFQFENRKSFEKKSKRNYL